MIFSQTRNLLLASSLVLLAACAHPDPLRVATTGALPQGRILLVENPSAEPLVPARDLAACLAAHGLNIAPNPEYLVQYTLALRPANSALLVGKEAENPPPPAKRRRRGERLLASLLVNKIADSTPAYRLSLDAPHQNSKAPLATSAPTRAALLCAQLGPNASPAP